MRQVANHLPLFLSKEGNMTLDARTFVHCECGLWVHERDDLEPKKAEEGNSRCKHREELIHYSIVRLLQDDMFKL